MVKSVRVVCAHDCPDMCSLIASVEDGKVVRVQGDPDHPYTAGFACGKVNRDADLVNSPERIKTPLKRIGAKGSGQFRPISWDEALDEIAKKWKAIIKESGPLAILGYAYSAHQGLLNRGLVLGLFHALGTSRLQAGTVCDTCCEEAWNVTVGPTGGADPVLVMGGLALNLLWPWLRALRRQPLAGVDRDLDAALAYLRSDDAVTDDDIAEALERLQRGLGALRSARALYRTLVRTAALLALLVAGGLAGSLYGAYRGYTQWRQNQEIPDPRTTINVGVSRNVGREGLRADIFAFAGLHNAGLQSWGGGSVVLSHGRLSGRALCGAILTRRPHRGQDKINPDHTTKNGIRSGEPRAEDRRRDQRCDNLQRSEAAGLENGERAGHHEAHRDRDQAALDGRPPTRAFGALPELCHGVDNKRGRNVERERGRDGADPARQFITNERRDQRPRAGCRARDRKEIDEVTTRQPVMHIHHLMLQGRDDGRPATVTHDVGNKERQKQLPVDHAASFERAWRFGRSSAASRMAPMTKPG